MRNEAAISRPLGGSIYTLAQSGTGKRPRSIEKPAVIVNGKGSEISNQERLQGKARRKMITQAMALSMVDVVKGKGEDERKQTYWNTYHCQNKLYSAGGKLYGKYCKNRHCTSCCANRKADIINRYLPVIETWEDPFFVTLTVRAVPARQLKKRINDFVRAFRIIKSRCKKRSQRGKGVKFVGIKSLECNFNPVTKTYNPHFHLIVPNKEMADVLVKEWVALWTGNDSPKYRRLANKYAQFAERVRSREKGLMEIVKYGSKIFTEPDVKKKSRGNDAKIYAAALDNILCAMKGHRIFERFGFNLPELGGIEVKQDQILKHYEEWQYDSERADWLNTESESLLSDYVPPPQLVTLLESCINKDIE